MLEGRVLSTKVISLAAVGRGRTLESALNIASSRHQFVELTIGCAPSTGLLAHLKRLKLTKRVRCRVLLAAPTKSLVARDSRVTRGSVVFGNGRVSHTVCVGDNVSSCHKQYTEERVQYGLWV